MNGVELPVQKTTAFCTERCEKERFVVRECLRLRSAFVRTMASRATAAKGCASADKAIGSSHDCDARSELGSSDSPRFTSSAPRAPRHPPPGGGDRILARRDVRTPRLAPRGGAGRERDARRL